MKLSLKQKCAIDKQRGLIEELNIENLFKLVEEKHWIKQEINHNLEH